MERVSMDDPAPAAPEGAFSPKAAPSGVPEGRGSGLDGQTPPPHSPTSGPAAAPPQPPPPPPPLGQPGPPGEAYAQQYYQPEPVVGIPVGGPYAFPTPATQAETQQMQRDNKMGFIELASVLVFVGGCFCPFVWCAGFIFIRSESKMARNFGGGSLAYLCCFLVIMALLVVVGINATRKCNNIGQEVQECLDTTGCSFCLSDKTCTTSTRGSCSRKSNDVQSICRESRSPGCDGLVGCKFCFLTGRCSTVGC